MFGTLFGMIRESRARYAITASRELGVDTINEHTFPLYKYIELLVSAR